MALRQHEAGTTAEEICRKLGIVKGPSTGGRRSLVAWEFRSCVSSVRCRRRTAG
jgi:cystathionine beta-lyase/cystathionine gamma-synthase